MKEESSVSEKYIHLRDQFTNLHVHTEYSLLDGACRIKELIARVKELGQKSVAITDQGCMYGVIDFYEEAVKQGIKPIIGCEVYVSSGSRFERDPVADEPYHLILLCENNQGYSNLVKLVSLSNSEGFYRQARVDMELLSEYHEGLIGLSVFVEGEISRTLLEGDYEGAKKVALKYQEIFGKDNFFQEIQPNVDMTYANLVSDLGYLCKEVGITVVATNNIHYVNESDADIHDMLLCIKNQMTLKDLEADESLQDMQRELYLKTYGEMRARFRTLPKILSNTQIIAKRCNVTLEFGKLRLPKYQREGVADNVRFMKYICYKGLIKRYGEKPNNTVRARMDYELKTIISMGYVDYFLIVWDYIHYAKTHDIPVGCGRGSGAGSICAYCMGITSVDPIKYSLLFERFLNPERVSMPDFDIDFCVEGRSKVIEYVIDRYGKDRVAQIATFGKMGARSSIRDVGRILGYDYDFVGDIANYIPCKTNITLDEALKENPDFERAYRTDKTVRKIVDTAKRIEGLPRNVSTHAAGIVISAEPTMNLVPISINNNSAVTQYNMNNLERLGMLKMDFLGLRNLTTIRKCQDYIQMREPYFDVDSIPLDDIAVYSMLARGETLGVFQFESVGITDVLVKLVPKNFEDLIAVISLYRPGPMDSIPQYLENRHHPERITYETPQLKPILESTYGCIVYQEQVMEICRTLANYTYGHADVVRRAMAKKKHDTMAQERESFVKGCESNGISSTVANSIFDKLVKFSAYAFNKSHATCYAYLAYQTAYLRCHYFREYMTALMSTNVGNDYHKFIDYLTECETYGVRVLKPSVNESNEKFTISSEVNSVHFGLSAIKNIGVETASKIVKEREKNGKYIDIRDFCKRLSGNFDINKKVLETLIKAGAFDGLSYNRNEMLSCVEGLLSFYADYKIRSITEVEGQMDFFGEISKTTSDEFEIPRMEELDSKKILRWERELTGLYISGHPINDYQVYFHALKLETIANLKERCVANYPLDNTQFNTICSLETMKIRKDVNNQSMAFIRIVTSMFGISGIIFADTYKRLKPYLIRKTVMFIKSTVSMKEGFPDLIVNDVIPIDTFVTNPCYYANKIARKLEIFTTQESLTQTALVCDKLNSLGGGIPIVVKLTDRKQSFVPRSKPTTTLDDRALKILTDYKVTFEYNFDS